MKKNVHPKRIAAVAAATMLMIGLGAGAAEAKSDDGTSAARGDWWITGSSQSFRGDWW